MQKPGDTQQRQFEPFMILTMVIIIYFGGSGADEKRNGVAELVRARRVCFAEKFTGGSNGIDVEFCGWHLRVVAAHSPYARYADDEVAGVYDTLPKNSC